jgi:hypothetical protein
MMISAGMIKDFIRIPESRPELELNIHGGSAKVPERFGAGS